MNAALLIALLVFATCAALLVRRAAYRARLTLLGELAAAPAAGLTPDQAMAAALERLRIFFAAENCLAVLATGAAPRVVAAAPAIGPAAALMSLGSRLLALPEACHVSYRRRVIPGWPHASFYFDDRGQRPDDCSGIDRLADELTAGLGRARWVSVVIAARGAARGRLYLLAPRGQFFSAADRWLLRQAADIIVAQAALLTRIEQLAQEAAGRERSRISLDLHDGAIQPYLGLKLGLEALQRKLTPDHPLAQDVAELCRMTQESIDELRGYVRVLEGRRPARRVALIEDLQRQTERFGRLYGIEVAMNVLADVELGEPLTAELLQMIGESLSNIGRHTASRQATINVSASGGELRAEVIDSGDCGDGDGGAGRVWQRFTPGSLARRVRALGGRVDVAPRVGGGSAVTLTIPLSA